MSKSVSFFATTDDVESVLAALENSRDVKYTLTGTFDQPNRKEYSSYRDIEHLGVASKGDQNHEATYLVSDRQSTIALREIEQRNGTTRYAVDQVLNPATIAVRPGGLFGDDCVIAGQIGTATTDPDSLALFKLLAGELRRRFRKVKSFWVGPEASRILKNGGRLTTNIKSPCEYDLTE